MIHHFYHIYADGAWQEPVSEHLRALKMGLYENLTTFKIGIVGSPENREKVKAFIDLKFEVAAEADIGWEQVTMIPMWEFCQTNEGLMIYAHTKGASSPVDVNIRWRRSMTYWNILKWQDAVEKLKTHGAYACHWLQPSINMPEHKLGNWMAAGTFFWTHCNLMKEWPKPALTHRHEAEGFIGYGWHQKNFPVYDPTPYFPNSNEFADEWINNPEWRSTMEGKSYG